MSNVTNKRKEDVAFAWKLCLALVFGAAAIMLPDLAFATSNDTPIGSIYCRISGWATGNTGKGLATIAITVIGLGALLGKVSWGMALVVAVGIALIFGASALVDALGVTPSTVPCTTNSGFR